MRLVDFGEVGLPVFRLTLEAVTMAHRSMPTIQEFVMRCLAVGETSEAAIARMLGLKSDVVAGAINALVSDGYVARSANVASEAAFKLTEAGDLRLLQEREELPQEEMLVIDYDAIRRQPLRLTGESVVRAFELNNSGAIQIRPYPVDAPAIEELGLLDVTKVIRRQAGDDFRRTVLALKRIVRRNNVFREAVALVYAADQSDEIQVAFAIGDKLSEPHERAFAENAGPRKMGFVKTVGAADARRRLEKLVGRAMIKRLPDPLQLRLARREEAEASANVISVRPIAERVTGRARHADPSVVALAAAEERLQIARFALDTLEVRSLACFEIDDLLDEALKSARRSLLVTSAGLQGAILNGYRLRAIDHLVASGVKVEIETALEPQIASRGSQYDPLAELTKRSDRGALALRKRAPEEFYFLIQDDALAVIANRPFLGEKSRRKGFMRVEGLVTRRAELVEEIRTIALVPREAPRRVR
jgi:DNA-binding MarR family transcriptional regulator